jgi:tripartite-type tricarboxylate transporter receptor subunit TctC
MNIYHNKISKDICINRQQQEVLPIREMTKERIPKSGMRAIQKSLRSLGRMKATFKRTIIFLVLAALISVIPLGCNNSAATPTTAPTKSAAPATTTSAAATTAAAAPTKAATTAAATTTASATSASDAAALTGAGAEFYKGKTVTIYVGSAAGGYTDVLARFIAQYLPEVTGAKFVVQNETGGGGRVILNQIYGQIKNDGLSLLFMPAGSIWPGFMTGDTSVQYDITKFQYVGGIEAGNALISTYPKGKYKTLDDLMKAKGLKFAATNKTTLPTVANALGIEILGLDAKIITGFDSSTGRQLAIQQGDADATVMSSDTTAKGAKDGIMLPLAQIGVEKMKTYPNIPCLTDIKKADTLTDNQKKMLGSIDLLTDAKALIAPPGTPQERVDFLNAAFKKIYDSSNLKADIQKASGEEAAPYIGGKELGKKAVDLAAKKGDMKLWTDILAKYVE